jgi:hypothetical protein
METKKTFADQMISCLFQKDCAFSYYQEIDKLRKKAVEAAPDAPVYCYQSLGGVDCYAAPGPYDPRRQPLGGMAQQNRQKKAYRNILKKNGMRKSGSGRARPRQNSRHPRISSKKKWNRTPLLP